MSDELLMHNARAQGPARRFPEAFGRYLLLCPIAAGGMAEVFLADMMGPMGFRRRVAVKRIHVHLRQDEEFIHSFVDEARVGGLLNHPHIVKIEDLQLVDGLPCLAMEYVEGGHLGNVIARAARTGQALPAPMVAELIRQVALGLEFAHRAVDPRGRPLQLIHRDIKPSNLLLGFDGNAKIVDFGIAKASSNVVQTMPDIVKGSLPYMSPEQAAGLRLTQASDLYSVGTVLFELLTRVRLFQSDNQIALISMVARGPTRRQLAPLDVLPPEARPLGAIARSLLATDPDQRPGDAAALLKALDQVHLAHLSPVRMAALAREWLEDVTLPIVPQLEVPSYPPRQAPLEKTRTLVIATGEDPATARDLLTEWKADVPETPPGLVPGGDVPTPVARSPLGEEVGTARMPSPLKAASQLEHPGPVPDPGEDTLKSRAAQQDAPALAGDAGEGEFRAAQSAPPEPAGVPASPPTRPLAAEAGQNGGVPLRRRRASSDAPAEDLRATVLNPTISDPAHALSADQQSRSVADGGARPAPGFQGFLRRSPEVPAPLGAQVSRGVPAHPADPTPRPPAPGSSAPRAPSGLTFLPQHRAVGAVLVAAAVVAAAVVAVLLGVRATSARSGVTGAPPSPVAFGPRVYVLSDVPGLVRLAGQVVGQAPLRFRPARVSSARTLTLEIDGELRQRELPADLSEDWVVDFGAPGASPGAWPAGMSSSPVSSGGPLEVP